MIPALYDSIYLKIEREKFYSKIIQSQKISANVIFSWSLLDNLK